MKTNHTAAFRAAGALGVASFLAVGGGIGAAQAPKVLGIVIDHSPATSGIYIGSPSVVILPNGAYVASHDEFGPKSTYTTRGVSRIFRSQDRGQTWQPAAVLQGQWHGGPFVHGGELYTMGTDREYGDVVIRRSHDGGDTWTTPTDGSNGRLTTNGQYHTAPVPLVEHAGRLWRAYERRDPPTGWGTTFRAGMLSAPADADLLNATNWVISNFVPGNTSWLGGKFGGWLEGNAVLTPEGKIVNILRVETPGYPEKGALVSMSVDGKTASFDPATGFFDMPGGAKKFTIRFDLTSGCYWAVATPVRKEDELASSPGAVRNTLALMRSKDLREWEIRSILVHHPEIKKHGFQYAEWQFDGEDIVAAVRTAFDDESGGAHSFHDANYLTFHRIRDFRTLRCLGCAKQFRQSTASAQAASSDSSPAAVSCVACKDLLGARDQAVRLAGGLRTPMEGKGATIAFYGDGQPDLFKTGARLFTDREFTVAEKCPAWLVGKWFLRRSIGPSVARVTHSGVLTVLTQAPVPGAAAWYKVLEQRGFAWVAAPESFQLFGKQPFDSVRVYQKPVKAGEWLRFGKWTVLVGFRAARPAGDAPPSAAAHPADAWRLNTGERLYNGIVLPVEWPPVTVDPSDDAPMVVPYLLSPPDVIPIDVGRQLFVDDFLIATNTLDRVFHKPTKHTGNPVLKPETPLELCGEFDDSAVVKGGGLWWDPAEQLFKLWYEAGWLRTIAYATSRDGLRWDRPRLDVVPGSNQVLPPDLVYDSGNVVLDWDTKDPQQRYKFFFRRPGGNVPGMSLTSPDGIHWTNRVVTGMCGDRSTMFYNPFRKKWVYSLRSGFRGRSRDYWESDDFLAGAKWPDTGPVHWAAADRDDPKDPDIGRVPQLYNLDAVPYESLMLGFYEIHHGPENDVCAKKGLPKITDLNFCYSRDGFHWCRPDRRAHIASERWGSDAWDRGYVQPLGNLCTVRGDTLWFYYSAFHGDPAKTNVPNQLNGMHQSGATGIAFLRRDGFASLEAGNAAAALTTRPVTFSGTRVFVNADVRQGGELRIEILDKEGRPVRPYTLENCKAVTTDSTLEPVVWNGADDVTALRNRPVCFRFSLRRGSLYSFWVSRDATGCSDGYVAGGGPGFTGPTDTVGRAALEAERQLGGTEIERIRAANQRTNGAQGTR